jgi:hypothetical protein
MTQTPDLNKALLDAIDGETPALRLTCDWLQLEVDDLFQDMPSSDSPT